jgi:hypothetical protein
MVRVIHIDFRQAAIATTLANRIVAHYAEWVAPSLEAAHIRADRQKPYRAAYLGLVDELMRVRRGTGEVTAAHIRQVLLPTLRRALLAAYDARTALSRE